MAKVTRLRGTTAAGLSTAACICGKSPTRRMRRSNHGQDLRKARQRRGGLVRISAILKIRKDHLEALEESNFENSPGALQLGFVRTYAE